MTKLMPMLLQFVICHEHGVCNGTKPSPATARHICLATAGTGISIYPSLQMGARVVTQSEIATTLRSKSRSGYMLIPRIADSEIAAVLRFKARSAYMSNLLLYNDAYLQLAWLGSSWPQFASMLRRPAFGHAYPVLCSLSTLTQYFKALSGFAPFALSYHCLTILLYL